MKKIFVLALMVSLPLLALPESGPAAGNVVPTNDIIVSSGAATDLGWAKPDQKYYCLGQTKTGYSILVQANGKSEVGFISFRDEWGHATAITWEHDSALGTNTILIKTPIKIESGRIVLEKGKQYPVTAAEVAPAEPAKLSEKTAGSDVAKVGDATTSVHGVAAPPLVPDAPKVEEEKTLAAEPEPAQEIPKIKHAAIGAKITVSSTHAGEAGEGGAEALVDGDLQTRWSSEYSEPQEVVVELGEKQKLARLRLHWEVAAAVNYNVLVSADGKEWTKTQTMTDGKIGPRIDELDMKDASAKFIKLELLNRVHDTWGFSLYEIEAVGQE
jgi:hypothetical protein